MNDRIFTSDDFSLFLLLRISSAAPLILEAEGMFFLVLRSGLEENSSCSFWLSSDTNQALKLSCEKSGALVSSSVVGLLPGSTLRHEDTKLMEWSLLHQEYVNTLTLHLVKLIKDSNLFFYITSNT